MRPSLSAPKSQVKELKPPESCQWPSGSRVWPWRSRKRRLGGTALEKLYISETSLPRRSSEIAPDRGLQRVPSLLVKRTASSRCGFSLRAGGLQILMLFPEAMGGRTKARVKTPSPDRPMKVQKETGPSGHSLAVGCRSASDLRGYWHRAPQQGRFLAVIKMGRERS